jgi:ATP-dependent Lon protease
MTKINHTKKFSKNEDKKTKDTREKDNRKYKKGDNSGSESDEEKKYSGSGSDGGGSDDGGGGEKFDMLEYRKMLAEIFPSKYMNERISKLESKEKIAKSRSTSTSASNMAVCASNTSNKKSNKNENDKNNENNEDSNRKITRSMAKEMDIKPKELKSVEKGKKRGSHNPPPPLPIQDEYDTSSTSTNCSDSEDEYSRSGSEDDKYSAGFGEFAKEQLKSGKFNIVINLVNDKKHSNLDEDDSEYDSEEDSEYDDDDDDDDSDYDSEEDDSEYDDDDDTESDPNYNPDVDMDEGENTIVSNDIKDYKSGKSYKTSTHDGDRKSSDKGKIGGAGGAGGAGGDRAVMGAKGGIVSTEAESLETIQKIKHQMEDILKCNKHDSIARETLGIMVKKEKEYKDREEKKIKSRQKNHVKMFKKMLRKKNSTNDLKYFKDNLTTEEQTDVLKELEDLNKLTITDKPYRLSLLQSDIPQAFKAIALKKITNLRYMEPGAGEYYKIKNWVDTFMQIPFGKNCNLPLTISDGIEKCHDFMENAKSTLDCAVYGLNDAKMQIMQMLGQWIANPAAMGTAIAINGPMGTGKCHAYDTQILMYDGSIKMVQDIVVGDKVMGDDSKCRNVISLGRGEDDMYDIVHLNGEKYGVNSEHIMCLKQSGMNIIKTVKTNSGGIRYKVIYFDKNDYKQHSKRFCELEDATRYLNDMKLEHDYIEIPVKTLLKLPKYISVNLKGYKRGVEFSSKKVPFDPYIIGAWLGDGTSTKSEITNQDATILHYLRTELKKYNLNLVHRAEYTYGISYDMHKHDTRNNKNKFLQVLKDYKLIGNKHIPVDYKTNDRQTRLELLAGIIDTDGSYCDDSKGYDIIQKNKVLADDILFVARSLGFSANMKQCEKSCMYKGEKRTGTYHRIHLSGDNLSSIPVKCPRKMAKNERVMNKDSMIMGITIEPRGWGKYYGFELDNNHKYLLGDFTVTHNTSLVKEGISKILNREFAFIPLGGATDSSYLEGHSYTYEGSTWGKIVDILIRSKSMNPVIYFDELDKISETPKGEEIIGILTHLTDTTQNSQFHDKYFAEIDFDLSKCLFIFSYNDPLKVNPILLDRMYKIKTTGYKVKDKIVIAKQYLIPKIRYEVNFNEGDIIIPDETLNYIIDNYTEKEDGVRNLKRCIEIVYKKLNLYRLVKPGTTLFEKDNTLVVQFPFTVTNEIVNNLIKKDESGIGKAAINMYL